MSNVLDSFDLADEATFSSTYTIEYKFLDAEFAQNGQIRIVQDISQLSPVNGYLHSIRVPASHHLRIFGKSNKVKWIKNLFKIFLWLINFYLKKISVKCQIIP